MARVLHFIKSQLAPDQEAKGMIRRGSRTNKKVSLMKTPSMSKDVHLPRTRETGELLSQFEYGLVRASWTAMGPDYSNFMEMVLAKVFDENPSLQYSFLWDQISVSALMEHKTFKHIAAMMAKVVDVSLMRPPTEYNSHEIIVALEKVGSVHRKYKNCGFEEDTFDMWAKHFIETVEKIFLEGKNKATLIEAWSQLIYHMVEILKKGFSTPLTPPTRSVSSTEE